MNREQKIKKLGNAIKRLRGLKSTRTDKWVQPPDPSAGDDVVRWLKELGHVTREELQADINAILNFKTTFQYEEWIRDL